MKIVRQARGAALVLVTVSLVFAFMMGALLVAVIDRAGDRARAQSAADAAALAGLAEGQAGASALAVANGGELVSFATGENRVVVTVSVDGVEAEAAAERRLTPDREK